jgi:hypothetical protein
MLSRGIRRIVAEAVMLTFFTLPSPEALYTRL